MPARSARMAMASWLLFMQGAAAATSLLPSAARALTRGAFLRITADLTGGLPLDHWKTRSIRHPEETALQAAKAVYEQQGGIGAYWAGLPAKLIEGSLCGGALMAAKEGTRAALLQARVPLTEAAIGGIAGIAGGVGSCLVLAPTTMLVLTTATTGKPALTTLREVAEGKRNFLELYTGGGSLALREATNWASREGLTGLARNWLKRQGVGKGAALEIGSGVIGGVLACWNHPFEIARIRQQRDQVLLGGSTESTLDTMRKVVEQEGAKGLYVGLVPRCALSAWLTSFMVVAPRLLFK